VVQVAASSEDSSLYQDVLAEGTTAVCLDSFGDSQFRRYIVTAGFGFPRRDKRILLREREREREMRRGSDFLKEILMRCET